MGPTRTELARDESAHIQDTYMSRGRYPDGVKGGTYLHKLHVKNIGTGKRKERYWLTTEDSQTTDAWRKALDEDGYSETK